MAWPLCKYTLKIMFGWCVDKESWKESWNILIYYVLFPRPRCLVPGMS